MSIELTGGATITITDTKGESATYTSTLTPPPCKDVSIDSRFPSKVWLDDRCIIDDLDFTTMVSSASVTDNKTIWVLIEIIDYLTKDK